MSKYYDDIIQDWIPEGEEVVFTSPSGDTQAVHIHTLAKAWVLNGKLENPFTREPLDKSTEERVKLYKLVTFNHHPGVSISIGGLTPVWMSILIITERLCGSSLDCIQFDLLADGVSLYSYDMNAEIFEVCNDSKVEVYPHTSPILLRNLSRALVSQGSQREKDMSIQIDAHLRHGSVIVK